MRPDGFNLADYLNENCFNGIHGEPVTVHLKAVGITARIFAERQFHPSQRIIERRQRRGSLLEIFTIAMRVANGRGLIRFILSHLPHVEVLAPPELKREAKRILEERRLIINVQPMKIIDICFSIDSNQISSGSDSCSNRKMFDSICSV